MAKGLEKRLVEALTRRRLPESPGPGGRVRRGLRRGVRREELVGERKDGCLE